MAERQLMVGEYAVLALLTIRPMHGYDMARYFAEDLHEVCPIEQSLLYSYVKTLERRELVEWDEERVGNRPPRKVYRLTRDGEELVWDWLGKPVPRMREARLDLLLKIYVLGETDPAARRQLLDEQVAVCRDYRDRLAERVDRSDGFARLVAQSKLSAGEATLDWLERYRAGVG